MKFNLKDRVLEEAKPPFVIAEIGSNFKSLEDCLSSIRIAKRCGADAVKFQLYNYKSLYGLDREKYAYPSYILGTLPVAWLPLLKEEADKEKIEFMCSAFSPDLLDEVNKYVNIHKLASAEMTHVQMLEKLYTYQKPMFISTGAHNKADIGHMMSLMKGAPVLLMYCVASYPARGTQIANIRALREEFNVPTGFSDHSIDYLVTPIAALLAGALVIEKHVNFTRHQDTPDAPHSLNEREFREMVKALNGEFPPQLCYKTEELDMIVKHNRRLIMTKDQVKGDTLKLDENYGVYRSLQDDCAGLSAFLAYKINGARLLRDFKAGEPIGPNDIGN